MRAGWTIIAVTGAAAAIAGCGGGQANNSQKAAAPAALTPGGYEVTAELLTIRSTDNSTPRLNAQPGARTTRNICVAAGAVPADLFVDDGETCDTNSSNYVRNGTISVTMRCTRTGWTGNLLYGAEGTFTAEGFEISRRLSTQLSGDGDFQSTARVTGRRVGECDAAPPPGNAGAPAPGNATAPAGRGRPGPGNCPRYRQSSNPVYCKSAKNRFLASFGSSAGGRADRVLDVHVSALIARIYEGAGARDQTAQAVEQMLDVVGGGYGLVAVADHLKRDFNEVQWFSRFGSRFTETAREYEEEMGRFDPTFRFIEEHPGARFYDATRHMDARAHDTDAYMNWFEDRFQSQQWMLSYTPVHDGLSFGISVQPRPREQFDKAQERLFRMLFEHFERAQRLAARPADLSSHDTAVVLVDRTGRMIAASVAADRLLGAGDGLVVRGGMVEPQQGSQRRQWAALLQSAAQAIEHGTAGGVMALTRASGRRPLVVTIDPLPPQTGIGITRGQVLLRIVDLDAGLPPAVGERWRTIFALTPAEARLAETLLGCDGNLREAADMLRVGYATARTQLGSIFLKTETRTQGALARLLTSAGQTSGRADG